MRGPAPRGITPGTLTSWVYAIGIESAVEVVVVDPNRAWARGPPTCRGSTENPRGQGRAATRPCGRCSRRRGSAASHCGRYDRRRGARHECHLSPSWWSCRALLGVGCRDSRVCARGWGMRIPLPRDSRGRNHSCATMLGADSGSHGIAEDRRRLSHRKNLLIFPRLRFERWDRCDCQGNTTE